MTVAARLPAARDSREARYPRAFMGRPMYAMNEQSKLRVLVVDDHVDGADLLCELLQAMDCATAVAYNGADALTMASSFSAHLAFIDLEMPGMNGREVVRQLRANHPDSETRFICLTGRGLPEDRHLCLEAGFDEFNTKPLGRQALAQVLAAANARR